MITYEHGSNAHVIHCETRFNKPAMISYEHNVDFEHHGIKGMKWGIRRYQNSDGSYTAQGLQRYRAAEKNYTKAADSLKKAKADYKADKSKSAKAAYKQAKADRKEAKKTMSNAYDQVTVGNRMDKGKAKNSRKYYEGAAATLGAGTAIISGTSGVMKGVSAMARRTGKGYGADLATFITGTLSNALVGTAAATGASVLAGMGIYKGIKQRRVMKDIKNKNWGRESNKNTKKTNY